MTKHKVKVSKSTGPEGTGIGLFTEESLAAGTSIPVKGICFDSLDELNAWLAAQPTRTAEVMAKNLVEVNFCQPPDTETKGGEVLRHDQHRRLRECVHEHHPEGKCAGRFRC